MYLCVHVWERGGLQGEETCSQLHDSCFREVAGQVCLLICTQKRYMLNFLIKTRKNQQTQRKEIAVRHIQKGDLASQKFTRPRMAQEKNNCSASTVTKKQRSSGRAFETGIVKHFKSKIQMNLREREGMQSKQIDVSSIKGTFLLKIKTKKISIYLHICS